MSKQVFPLSKLTEAIENVIKSHCSKIVWVKAEIVKLNYYQHTGHCYPELVEKRDGRVIAEIRGNIWRDYFEVINEKFRAILGEELGDDMTVVLRASVTYHSVFGIALNIVDMDPEYTVGELARQKVATIKQLQKENLFYGNKNTQLPVLPKTIAIISVSTSKGYLDFKNVIDNNPWGYTYYSVLFPAVLQGEKAVTTIMNQLENIKKYLEIFDAVCIIRGGGGEIGLSCYNDYNLAKAIAGYPIPVLTGIGHVSNETVCELVSYQSFITPTKIAEFLLQEFNKFAIPLKEQTEKLRAQVFWKIERENDLLSGSLRIFGAVSARVVERNTAALNQLKTSIGNTSRNLLTKEVYVLNSFAESLKYLSPQSVLQRGYSITRSNGKVVTNVAHVAPGDILETELSKGTLKSKIETTSEN